MPLPQTIDASYFDSEFRLRPELWKDRVLDLAREKGLPIEAFHAFPDGSNLVASLGGRFIVKIFPAKHRHQWESDRRVLRHLQGRLKTSIPAFIDEGELEASWTYLVMSQIPGQSYEAIWPKLTTSEKAEVLFQIGALMHEMHALAVGPLEDLPPAWPAFLAKQIDLCKARHEGLQMPAWFTEHVDDFIKESLAVLPQNVRSVILTGEYTPFNLLADPQRPTSLIGMIDFGDSMIGPAAYDFLGPCLFLCEGKRELLQALFQGYGLPTQAFDKDFRRCLFLLQILHRYSDFNAQVRIPDWRSSVASFDELENLIWPLEA